jgi:outer membrane receptor protein involved in Fe transport
MSLGIDSQYDQEVTLDCTGLRFNCTPGITSEFGGSQTNDAQASLNVKEVALEVNVPLLRDVAVAQALNLNGAVRYADYSTSGSAWTWKVGLDWHLTNALRLRATRSRDFRAPTLYDLFAPPSSIVFNFTDIHTNNTTAVTMNETRGNPDLKAEVANTLTAGLVYDVPFVPGLSFSVDYYKIKLNNAIGSIGPDQETQQQCEASNGTSPLCDLFIRPFPFSNTTSANFPTKVLNQSLNLASLQVEGVDAELNFRKDVGPGTLTLRALVNYQPDYVTQRFTGTRIINEAGGPNRSKWRATGLFAYDLASYSIAVQQRWRSAQRPFTDPLVVSSGIGAIKAVAYTDLTFTARVGEKDRFSFFLSAQNLFDKDPPLYPGAAGATPGFFYPTVNGDDVIGRYFTAGFKANF